MVHTKRKYSDGGKVVDRKYGKPTYLKALAAKVGASDGYEYFPDPKKDIKDPERFTIQNATAFEKVVGKRKKDLDEY